MRPIFAVTAMLLVSCGVNDESALEDPLDDEFGVDEKGLLVYPSTGQFEEEPPAGGWQLPDDYAQDLAIDGELGLPDADDFLLEEGVIDPTLATELPPDVADGEVGEASQPLVSCTRSSGTGYRNGNAFHVTLVKADYKPAGRNAANAFYYMERAAARAGVSLIVNSAFRTMAQQRYLYNCYLTKRCNSGNLAARPGYSNHQSAIALDISTRSSRVYTWLKNHARAYGYVRTVPSEPWHWEYRGDGRSTPCRP